MRKVCVFILALLGGTWFSLQKGNQEEKHTLAKNTCNERSLEAILREGGQLTEHLQQEGLLEDLVAGNSTDCRGEWP